MNASLSAPHVDIVSTGVGVMPSTMVPSVGPSGFFLLSDGVLGDASLRRDQAVAITLLAEFSCIRTLAALAFS